MYSSHRLLEHIANFTSLRDLDLLIYSLLKSIASFVKPIDVAMIRLDGRSRPLQHIEYHSGHCDVRYEDITLRKELVTVIEHMNNAGAEEHVFPVGKEYLAVFLMLSGRRSNSFLVMRFNKRISKVESFHVRGMLDIYRNFAQLLMDSQTDELTGLANRKTFDDAVGKVYEMLPPEDEEYPDDQRLSGESVTSPLFWLALVDIDHFKKINDNFGHLYGDEVLVLLAQIMKNCFREDDMLFRFGGEEFVVILRSPSQEGCSIALERLRKTIEDTEFPGVGRVTVSVGAVKMEHGVFHITLLDYADQSLYYSKNNGRNRVTFFDELVAKGEAHVETDYSGDVDLF